MRLNRVLVLLALAIAIGVALIWMEGQNLRFRQKLAETHRQREALAEEQARLRLTLSRLAAPSQLMENVKGADVPKGSFKAPTGVAESPARSQLQKSR